MAADFTKKLSGESLRHVYADGTKIYTSGLNGLYMSTDSGNTFIRKTTAEGLGHNCCYGIAVNGNNIYVATALGVAISTNGGASFVNKTKVNGLADNKILSIAFANNVIYAGTLNGLSYSEDGGNTFKTPPYPKFQSSWPAIYDIDVSGNNLISLATSIGFLLSQKDPKSAVGNFYAFTDKNGLIGSAGAVATNPSDGKFYVANRAGIFVSDTGPAPSPIVAQSIYSSFGVAGPKYWFKNAAPNTNPPGPPGSSNPTSTGLPNSSIQAAIIVNNKIYLGHFQTAVDYKNGAYTYCGGVSVSADGGKTFTNLSTGVSADVRYVAVSGTKIYAATGYGLGISN